MRSRYTCLNWRRTEPFALNTFQFVNGVLVPQNAYDVVSSASKKKYNHLFAKVYEALGHKTTGKTALLTRDNFIKDHFIIVQDCSTFGTVAVDEIKINSNRMYNRDRCEVKSSPRRNDYMFFVFTNWWAIWSHFE